MKTGKEALKESKGEPRKALQFYKEAVAELGGGSNGPTRYRIREWKPVYTKILVLLQKGMTVAQIAAEAEIGYTARQISGIVRDPLFRMKLSQYNRKMDVAIIEKATEEMTKFPEVVLARDKLAESAERASKVLLDLMNPRSSLSKKYSIQEKRLMQSIAQDVLDRVGLKSAVVQEDGRGGRDYSPEEIKSALENAKELEAISQRLDQRGSSYVLSREQRNGAEDTDALDNPAATEPSIYLETTEQTEAHQEED